MDSVRFWYEFGWAAAEACPELDVVEFMEIMERPVVEDEDLTEEY